MAHYHGNAAAFVNVMHVYAIAIVPMTLKRVLDGINFKFSGGQVCSPVDGVAVFLSLKRRCKTSG